MNKHIRRLSGIVLFSVSLVAVTTALAADGEAAVKVFVLAGQSNMEGKASNNFLDHQATDAKTKELFAHLRKDGEWIVRDDVFIRAAPSGSTASATRWAKPCWI